MMFDYFDLNETAQEKSSFEDSSFGNTLDLFMSNPSVELCELFKQTIQSDPTFNRQHNLSDLSFNNFLNTCNDNVTLRKQPYAGGPDICLYFYTVFTPIVLLLGLSGNSLCIRIFTRQRMRKQTTSIYFAALSVSDLLVLLFFVIPDWLERGLSVVTRWESLRIYMRPVVCQIFLFLGYGLRFLSVWMLVISTVERYIGVCHPLQRPKFCSRINAQRIIFGVVLISIGVSAWKPFLSDVRSHSIGGSSDPLTTTLMCTSKENFRYLSNILDSVYLSFLSVVPSCFVLIFNILISRRLLIFRRSDTCLSHKEMIGIQFAALLVLISTCFLMLSWPYYLFFIISWANHRSIENALLEDHRMILKSSYFDGAIHVTRSIFYLNYAVNFFLYSFTSQYFRSEMKRIFTLKDRASRPSTAEDVLDPCSTSGHQAQQMALISRKSNPMAAPNNWQTPDMYNNSCSHPDDGNAIAMDTIRHNPPYRQPLRQNQQQNVALPTLHGIRIYEKKYCFRKLDQV